MSGQDKVDLSFPSSLPLTQSTFPLIQSNAHTLPASTPPGAAPPPDKAPAALAAAPQVRTEKNERKSHHSKKNTNSLCPRFQGILGFGLLK